MKRIRITKKREPEFSNTWVVYVNKEPVFVSLGERFSAERYANILRKKRKNGTLLKYLQKEHNLKLKDLFR